jgi:hypothetical protein
LILSDSFISSLKYFLRRDRFRRSSDKVDRFTLTFGSSVASFTPWMKALTGRFPHLIYLSNVVTKPNYRQYLAAEELSKMTVRRTVLKRAAAGGFSRLI